MKEDKLTNAGVLLFGKEPQRFFAQSEVRCARFKGDEAVKPFVDWARVFWWWMGDEQMNIIGSNTGTVATNILTVDVEDWYMDTDISTWGLYEDRVVESTNKIIKLLNESDTKATFFILGYVAEHFPELVERIRDEGHEVATHGYSHTPITQQTPSEFEEDLLKSVGILEQITGDKVMGYRACQFTVVEETAWAIDVLKKNGLRYDSSVFPVKTHLYGVPDAPLFPYRISPADITKEADPEEDFLEIPLSVYRIPVVHKNIPVAGGFYMRFFPYWFIKHAMKKINGKRIRISREPYNHAPELAQELQSW